MMSGTIPGIRPRGSSTSTKQLDYLVILDAIAYPPALCPCSLLSLYNLAQPLEVDLRRHHLLDRNSIDPSSTVAARRNDAFLASPLVESVLVVTFQQLLEG